MRSGGLVVLAGLAETVALAGLLAWRVLRRRR